MRTEALAAKHALSHSWVLSSSKWLARRFGQDTRVGGIGTKTKGHLNENVAIAGLTSLQNADRDRVCLASSAKTLRL
jgi:hypothetical protein